jgi:hypothetical protein
LKGKVARAIKVRSYESVHRSRPYNPASIDTACFSQQDLSCSGCGAVFFSKNYMYPSADMAT